MLKFISLAILVFSLSSCVKEAPLDAFTDAYELQDSYNINVFVTLIEEPSNASEYDCPTTTDPVSIGMENVAVFLLEGLANEGDFSTDKVIKTGITNGAGKTTIKSLPSGDYSIYITTEHGDAIRTLTIDGKTTNHIAVEFIEEN